jgi:hypothetical protein
MALRGRHFRAVVVAVAALGALALVAAAPPPVVDQAAAAKNCGTYASTSTTGRARVVVIRKVKCRRALRVAKKYDHQFQPPRPWACGLAHGGGRVLFSCGKGGTSGNIRDWPHALKAVSAG